MAEERLKALYPKQPNHKILNFVPARGRQDFQLRHLPEVLFKSATGWSTDVYFCNLWSGVCSLGSHKYRLSWIAKKTFLTLDPSDLIERKKRWYDVPTFLWF